MIVSDQAAIAAAEYVSRSIYGQPDGPDADDLRHGRELVMVIAPYILAAVRECVASLARVYLPADAASHNLSVTTRSCHP